MADSKDVVADCGCSKDTTVAALGRGPGCCPERDEAVTGGGGPGCCGPECCGVEEDVVPKGDIQAARRRLDIEFLYLDLTVCQRCQGTERSLEEALSEVAQVLELSGTELILRKTHVQTEEQARALGFVSSPTIRINGRDIQMVRSGPTDVKESPCGCGPALCGQDIDCRDWVYQGEAHDRPPLALIVGAILKEAFAAGEDAPETPSQFGDVLDNLRKFFTAKRGLVADKSVEHAA